MREKEKTSLRSLFHLKLKLFIEGGGGGGGGELSELGWL